MQAQWGGRRLRLCALLLAPAAYAQPEVPTNFSTTAGDGEAILQWADPQDADIERYEVRHGPSWPALGGWIRIPESGASTVRHTVTDLANGDRHHFELRAVSAVGAGEAARASTRLAARPDAMVEISDSELHAKVAWHLGIPVDSGITQGQMATLKKLGPGGPGLPTVDLAGIEYAVNLTDIRYYHSDISDLTPLASLTALTTLHISNAEISDLSPLTDLTTLTSLALENNDISNISALAGLTALKTLHLRQNDIADISPLAGLITLTDLDVGHNAISDLTPLVRLTALTYLGVGLNAISDVTPLADLAALVRLHAGTNEIVDIAALADLTALAWIDLRRNDISDISPLVSNQGIGEEDDIDLTQNPLSVESVEMHIHTLQDRGASVRFDPLPTEVPPAPSRIEAIPGDKQATLRWSYAHIHPSLSRKITRYEMRFGTGDPVDYGDWRTIAGSNSRTNKHTVIGLVNGTRYSFELRSVNALGTGEVASTATTLIENPSAEVTVQSSALREAVASYLGKSAGEKITRGEMALLRTLAVRLRRIAELTGIEHAVNLIELDLSSNEISNLSPLADLTALTSINLNNNEISDASPLATLTELTHLHLHDNRISDVSALAVLTALTELYLGANLLSTVSPLTGLTALRRLDLSSNEISDLSPLSDLTALNSLRCEANFISDISPLASNDGFSEGNFIGLTVNPLSIESVETYITTLQNRGVDVEFDPLPMDVPEAPIELNAMPKDGHVTLRWQGVSVHDWNRASIIRYEVRASTGDPVALAPWMAIAGSNWRTFQHMVTGLANGTRYVFEVRAVNVRGLGKAATASAALVTAPSSEAEIPSPTLRAIVNEQLGKTADATITRGEMAKLSTLAITRHDMMDLGWLEPAVNLSEVDFSDNQISDLAALSALAELTRLGLAGNEIVDISPLASLTALTHLDLAANRVADVTPLAGLTALTALHLRENDVVNISPLSGLTALNHLDLANNDIMDISALASLTEMTWLHLYENRVSDISALASLSALTDLNIAANRISDVSPLDELIALRQIYLSRNAIEDISALVGGIQQDGVVDLRGNPLNAVARTTHVPAMRAAGTVVRFDDGAHRLTFFPSAATGDSRRGFVRIINHSNEAGVVSVEATDESGASFGPTSLAIGANKAVHFNADDLEHGKVGLDLGGVGVGRGDWRLTLRSSLDIEVLGYVRTSDGFVTSMHDLVPEVFDVHDVPTFNPGSNVRQVSRLHVVNPTGIGRVAALNGVDDAGQSGDMWVYIAPGQSTFYAEDLEYGVRAAHFFFTRLGDGVGKWSLTLNGVPGAAMMNLLESPGGHLANISSWTGPARWSRGYREALRGGATYRISLFPSSASGQQGFLRIVDKGHRKPTLALRAFNAAAQEHGPATLPIGRGAALHFNTEDLEEGNSVKGLPGTGTGVGDWHLELRSNTLVRVLAYARAPDGFVTSLHDVAPRDENGSIWIPFFNPGNNSNQESRLRLVNWGEVAAAVAITAIDDAGRPGAGTVRVTIPAREARNYTAWELETGNAADLSGGLGDGEGKWRLRVATPDEVDAMSLLRLPTGHISKSVHDAKVPPQQRMHLVLIAQVEQFETLGTRTMSHSFACSATRWGAPFAFVPTDNVYGSAEQQAAGKAAVSRAASSRSTPPAPPPSLPPAACRRPIRSLSAGTRPPPGRTNTGNRRAASPP